MMILTKFIKKSTLGFLLFWVSNSYSQGTVTVDPNIKRYVGDISKFQREKYFNVHGRFKKEDDDLNSFISRYKLDSDFKGSRSFYNPIVKVKKGVFPKIRTKHKGVRKVKNWVDSGKLQRFFYEEDKVDYSVIDLSDYSKKMAQYVADAYAKQEDIVPKYFEPFNEPMVHAHEFYPKKKGKYNREKIDVIANKICQYHLDVAKSIHEIPELRNMNVIGFASAFPEFESKNFSLWNSRYKKFIDIAGEELDGFSIHLYDGRGHVNNAGGRRSGSNTEAILDLIEAYSYKALNKVKPVSITEYGRLVSNQPGFPGVSNYEPIENSQAVRSQIHMLMNFIERGNDIGITIPFSTGKNKPEFKYSKAGLWTTNGSEIWELTPRKYFFEIWKDVKGDRVYFNSSNVDVQTQAFVDGKKLYVVLNSLNDDLQKVDLNILNLKNIKKLEVKRLNIFKDKVPELATKKLKKAPSNIEIAYGETIVLTYVFKEKVEFNNSIYAKKYYTKKYMQPIKANSAIEFEFENVKTGKGHAVLRLGVGRDNKASLLPIIKINGKQVDVTGDLIRGYNQHNRRQFFGTLEIPFDISLLKNGKNKVEASFKDNGGHISSTILSLQKLEK